MNIIKRLWAKYQFNKYQRYLLVEGISEARSRGKNIHLGLDEKLVTNEEPFERIYLDKNESAHLDISPLLALGAENHPEHARKFLYYERILKLT